METVTGDSYSEFRTKFLEIEYVWNKGALLTSEDMSLLDPTKAGDFRRQGLEFVAVKAAARLQSLTLHVSIPRAYLPNPQEVFV